VGEAFHYHDVAVMNRARDGFLKIAKDWHVPREAAYYAAQPNRPAVGRNCVGAGQRGKIPHCEDDVPRRVGAPLNKPTSPSLGQKDG
jgi:hypothetical protein